MKLFVTIVPLNASSLIGLTILPHIAAIEATELFRLLRLFKLIRYSKALQTIGRVIAAKKDELLITLIAILILLIIAASVMYYAEHPAQPEAFPSILAAMWWAVVTLTTVGYGDVYPITPIGKIFGAILALIGIGLFALPAGIIASGFSEEIHRRKFETMREWMLAEKQELETHIEQSAELMKTCWDAAKNQLGDRISDEAALRDLATTLYLEAVRKFYR